MSLLRELLKGRPVVAGSGGVRGETAAAALTSTDKWSLLSTRLAVDAQERIDEAERFWKAVTDSLPAHMAVLDPQGMIVAVNECWRQFGLENGGGEYGVGWNYLAVCDASAAAGDASAGAAAASIRELIEGRRESVLEVFPCHGPDVERWFLMRVVPLQTLAGVVVQHHDVTHQHVADSDVRLQARLLNEVGSAVIALDRGRRVAFWNDAATRLYGWSAGEVLGERLRDRLQVEDDYAPAYQALRRDGEWEGILRVRRKDGVVLPVAMRNVVVRDTSGAIEWTVGVSSDASSWVEYETELRAGRDFQRALAESIPDGVFALGHDGAVLYLNPAGERLLGWASADLEGKHMHDFTHDVMADDPGPQPHATAKALVRQGRGTVEAAERKFIRRDGSVFPVSYKASAFETPTGVQGTVVVFRDVSDEHAAKEQQRQELLSFTWASRVRNALNNDQLVLYAQPIVETATRRVVRHELLLRLTERGRVINPTEFLPAAQRHDLMIDIDRWVIEHALQVAAAGHSISFNLSAESLSRTDLVADVETQLLATGADPRRLVIEVTETGVVENEAAAAGALARLAALGCQIALDDFGTGYGGFTHLKRLPVNILKIDKEFVLESTTNNRAVIRAIVSLAQAFGQDAVAEGVETEEALNLISQLGVPYAQGYLFGHPIELSQALERKPNL